MVSLKEEIVRKRPLYNEEKVHRWKRLQKNTNSFRTHRFRQIWHLVTFASKKEAHRRDFDRLKRHKKSIEMLEKRWTICIAFEGNYHMLILFNWFFSTDLLLLNILESIFIDSSSKSLTNTLCIAFNPGAFPSLNALC